MATRLPYYLQWYSRHTAANLFSIQITTGSDVPIFRQIVSQIRASIASGTLSVGDGLPSVRGLAAELVINHNTVAKAYSQLVQDGVIESQQGRGYFVAKRREIYTKAERTRRVVAFIGPMISEAKMLGFEDEELAELVTKEIDKLSRKRKRGTQ